MFLTCWICESVVVSIHYMPFSCICHAISTKNMRQPETRQKEKESIRRYKPALNTQTPTTGDRRKYLILIFNTILTAGGGTVLRAVVRTF